MSSNERTPIIIDTRHPNAAQFRSISDTAVMSEQATSYWQGFKNLRYLVVLYVSCALERYLLLPYTQSNLDSILNTAVHLTAM